MEIAKNRCAYCLVAVLATLCLSNAYAEQSTHIAEIRGLTVDFHLVTRKQWKTVQPSLEHQVDVAMSVDVPPSMMEFFRTVKIVIDPAMLKERSNGQYMQNDSPPYVRLKPIALPSERAILLHELMHAYHHQVLKQPTPDVEGAFRRALSAGIYPQEYLKAGFLRDSREYFAIVSTVYLVGTIEQPPYRCSIVKGVQPKFIAYLDSLFGKRECSN